jgi:hypothetical protein
MSTVDTQELVLPVTAQDLRALRHADSVVFRHHQGQSTIEANKDGSHTKDGFDVKHTVYVAGEVRDHDRARMYGREQHAAFYMVSGAQYSDTLLTLLRKIRPGDQLTLRWTAANDNQNDEAVGWHRDELRLIVQRDQQKRADVYLVAAQHGPDNTARMVRRVWS